MRLLRPARKSQKSHDVCYISPLSRYTAMLLAMLGFALLAASGCKSHQVNPGLPFQQPAPIERKVAQRLDPVSTVSTDSTVEEVTAAKLSNLAMSRYPLGTGTAKIEIELATTELLKSNDGEGEAKLKTASFDAPKSDAATVQQTSYDDLNTFEFAFDASDSDVKSQPKNQKKANRDSTPPKETITFDTHPHPPTDSTGGMPIDFLSVLRLAGADNWNVRIAHERICEAAANYRGAKAALLPSLNFGVGYNHHEGEIQATQGDVSTVSRSSLFAGGGAKVGNNPMAGGSGGPSRLSVDLSLADTYFQQLATKKLVDAEQWRAGRVFNDTMLESSLAYFELVRAQFSKEIAMENQIVAEQLKKLTSDFVTAGKGTPADTDRLEVIVNQRRRDVAEAKAQIGIASSRLATVLQLDRSRLDPDIGLQAMEIEVMPITLVPAEMQLSSLIAQALNSRQEIMEAELRASAAQTQLAAEQWRPLLPNLSVGVSNGAFGGGTGGNLPKMDLRNDVDLQMTWEVRNLGIGNRALRDARRSQLNQFAYTAGQIKDQIADEVTAAYRDAELQSETLHLLERNIVKAKDALRLNVEAIQGLEGVPLEALLSLQQLATARVDYLNALIDFNQAQLRLMRAIGEPIGDSL